MKRITGWLFLSYFFFISTAFALDGGGYTISGSGFGVASSSGAIWTGGLNSPVEASADDTDYTSIWDSTHLSLPPFLVDGSGHRNKWRVDTSRAYSRTRSLVWDSTDPRNISGGNQGEGTVVFTPGVSSLGKAYVSMNVYYTVPSNITYLQNKWIRLISKYTAEGGASGVDDGETPNLFIPDANGIGKFGANTGATFPPYASTASNFDDPGWSSTGDQLIPREGWYRLEFEFTDSSTMSSSDGEYKVKVTRLADNTIVTNQVRSNIPIYGSGTTSRFKYITIQWGLYNGDDFGSPGPTWGNAKIWMQDIFLQAGTRARVMLCDNAIYISATKCELQPWASWSNTNIGVTINQGSFSNLTGKYFFVWNDAGTLVNSSSGILYVEPGDVNGDGQINLADLLLLQKHLLQQITLSSAQLQRADVNGDSAVNFSDLIALQKKILAARPN